MKHVAIALYAATLAACMYDQEESSDETSLLQLARTTKQSKRFKTPSDISDMAVTRHLESRFVQVLDFWNSHEDADMADVSHCAEQILADLGGDPLAVISPAMVASWDECLDLAEQSNGVADWLAAPETAPHSDLASLLSASRQVPRQDINPEANGHRDEHPSHCEDGLPDHHPCNCAVQAERLRLYWAWILNAWAYTDTGHRAAVLRYYHNADMMRTCGELCKTVATWEQVGMVHGGRDTWQSSVGLTVSEGTTTTERIGTELSSTITVSMGFAFEGMSAGIEESQTRTLSNEVENSVHLTYDVSTENSKTQTWEHGGMVWRVHTTTNDTCGGTIETVPDIFTLTPTSTDRPRCMPGHCHTLSQFCCQCDEDRNLLTNATTGGVVDECKPRTCPAGLAFQIPFSGHSLTVYSRKPLMDHGEPDILRCRLSNGDYEGNIMIQCNDGAIEVIDHACHLARSETLPGQEHYLGCYIDGNNHNRAMDNYKGDGKGFESCRQLCSGFRYMGLQFGGQCFCGNEGPESWPSRYSIVRSTGCDRRVEPCYSTAYRCGGPARNAVYDISSYNL